MKKRSRILIVGGGFGGVYTAMYLEKLLKKRREDFEIALINKDNYFVFQPMLSEVVAGTLGIFDTVSSLRKLLPSTTLYIREVRSIDLQNKYVELLPRYTHATRLVEYDHLVLGMGTVTDFRGEPGLHQHAFSFKNLADCLQIRNQVLDALATAATTKNAELKQQLLTFVVGGGGFSGTEIVAELNDFTRKIAKGYPSLNPQDIRVVLVHSKDRLMERELSVSLSRYAERILQKRGVEILFNLRLQAATEQRAVLSNGESIPSRTVISTVPTTPNPLLESLNLPKEKGKIKTDRFLQVEGSDHVWAIGDCALIPLENGEISPPTAQFATREAKTLAHNIVASLTGGKKKTFQFKSLGMLGALGHHNAVAELFGRIKLSGFLAWIMWRFIYWCKLPGASRKIKVGLSWLLDMIIPAEDVELKIEPSHAIAQVHFEPGETIFHEGDIGDYLYIIIKGQVEVLKGQGSEKTRVAELREGEFFGEMALLNQTTRSATVRCVTPTDLLALRKSDFGMLITNFIGLKQQLESVEEKRKEDTKS